MKTAIVGLPMVGKTSLFTILTGVHESAKVGMLEARMGVARVPDARLGELAKLFDPPKITHATVEYLDFPAISKEALRDPSYLASLRVVDALAHVVRLFESDTVPHEKGSVDPMRDIEDLDMELALSDLVVVEKRLERLERERKKIKNPEFDKEAELLEKCKAVLEDSKPLRNMELSPEDEKRMRGFQFLSQKPMLFVLNLGEAVAGRLHEVESEYGNGLLAGRPQTAVAAVCGKIEAELAELPPEEAAEYMASYGLKDSGLARIISSSYSLLGLMSFLTAGETEVRAWTIPKN
ncbi:MAG: 50S ribosome-binding GTPase, partial [Acidobacteria bacterium]|nr:50S ribosome-binding GTPase [Acidobacteriota bacterium]